MRRLSLCFAALALALPFACKDPPGPTPRTYPLTVTFVAPHDGQPDVPATTRVWIRASGEMTGEEARGAFGLTTDSGEAVDCEVTLSGDRQAAVLAPASPLQPGRSYQVLFRRGPERGGDQVVSRFATRPAGTRSQDGFRVRAFLPMDVPGLSVWPFTTLRVLLSEPASPDSILGAGQPVVRLIRVATGEVVPAEVLVQGSTVALDPASDLQANERYRLELTGGARDLAGEALTPASVEVTVRPLAVQMRRLTLALGPTPVSDGGAPVSDGGAPGSRLEAKPPNTLELRSQLVGLSSLSLVGGLEAELPDPAQHGARLPMVMRKGQVLTVRGPDNGGLAIRLGGAIGTTLNSGPLSLTLLTDGSGEISENPLKPDAPGARPLVRMSMDAALTAGDPTVNAMLTQNMLAMQLVGELYVQEGRLGVELVGAVELDLLGLETGASSVTIGAWSAEEGTPAPAPQMTVRVISPPGESEDVELDRPLQVVFSQPPDSSARTGVWLERAPGDGVHGSADDFPTSMVTEGSLVLLRPRGIFDLGTQYVLRVAPGVRSVTGAALSSASVSRFRTREMNPTVFKPTAVASARPGVPCAFATDGGVRQCSPTTPSFAPFTLPSDLPVELHFTKPIEALSVQLGETVEVLDLDGGVPGGAPVAGRLTTGADWLRFTPDEPWREGHPYVVRLGREGTPDCSRTAVCDLGGRAVNTDLLLDDPEESEGGPPIELSFTGAARSGQGALALRLVPASDTNANGVLDLGAPAERAQPENSVTLRDPEDGGVVDRTYLFGTLLAQVGRFDPGTLELPLTVDVGSWMYGTSTNIFGITTDRLVIHPAAQQAGALRAPPPSDPDQRPIMTLPMVMYMHSVDRTVEEALQRAPLQMTLEGRLSFAPDGRMVAVMSNTNTAQLSLIQGRLTILITPGDVQVRASSGALGR